MRYIEVAKNSLNLSEEQIEKIKVDLSRIETVSNKYNLKFVDTFEISFVNHVISCIDRIYKGEKLEFMGEDLISELSEKALNISEEMLKDIYSQVNSEIDKAEVCLLATHIEVSLNQ